MTELVTIVVNWNTVGLLDDCLRSVVRDTPPGWVNRIVVVDNASHDGSVDHLRRHWPEVQVVANERNVGFCAANNQALRASTAPYALLLNTDARLHPGAIGTMLGYFERDPRAAIVGPRLVYGDGSFQRWTAGQPFTPRTLANYLLGIERLLPGRPGAAGIFLGRDTAVAFQPGWVSSAVMLVRRQAVEEVGLFDERLFVYMDDVDLCERVRHASWHVWYAPDCTATHFMGASSQRAPHGASPEALRALNRWYVRRHGSRAGRLLRALEVAGFAGRAAAYAGLSVLRPTTTARARMRAHATHVRLALEPIRV
ncbi:glycosyltransferase family 2 protein [Micromonospora sp. NBS 11-29]|uniref:glycosyltransferase family 2 protein n=1 Tax=Micromonospora sp. NBS 11-29 TaxID=1960879 RepID=UPI000B772814|nr:glycosyltransferase family 2 protein [Micromonospora sp. NBS 11-29]